MKLLNWNVKNSAEALIRRQMKVIDREDADIITLTEVNCRYIEFWQQQFCINGYETMTPQHFEGAEQRCALISSRLDVAPLPTLFQHPLPQCSVSAAVKINGHLVEIHSVYARADASWPIKQKFKKDILKAVALGVKSRSRPQIIAGDFNSPKKEIDGQIITNAQSFREKRGCWDVKGGKNADFWQSKHEAELSIFNPRKDMVDAYRNCRKRGRIARSWRNLRLDHIIASRSIMPISVRYTVDSRSLPEKFPSDHAPMIAEW